MDPYRRAFCYAISRVLASSVVDAEELLRRVYAEAGTIYIAPGRTVKDWLADIEDLGLVERKGVTTLLVKDRRALERILVRDCGNS